MYPQNRLMSYKILESASGHSKSLWHLNEIQFATAQLKRLEGKETQSNELLKQGNDEIMYLCKEEFHVAMVLAI